MSRTAARVISGYVSSHPDCVLGLATGSTPIGLYRCLVEDYEAGALSFKDVTSFNLDEYRGLDPQHDQTSGVSTNTGRTPTSVCRSRNVWIISR